MTERSASALATTHDTLSIGPGALRWDGASLHINFDEITAPVPRPIRGTVRVWPQALAETQFVLAEDGQHIWQPIAPRARVEVECTAPSIRWSGDGYFDHNRGDASLESGFRDWTWSRASTREGAVVFYDGIRRDGTAFELGLRFDANGGAHPIVPPLASAMPPTRWRMKRSVRSDRDARIIRTLADAPFYARSTFAAKVEGEDVVGVHESLSLDRFRTPIVQVMLPFRVPRRR